MRPAMVADGGKPVPRDGFVVRTQSRRTEPMTDCACCDGSLLITYSGGVATSLVTL